MNQRLPKRHSNRGLDVQSIFRTKIRRSERLTLLRLFSQKSAEEIDRDTLEPLELRTTVAAEDEIF